jgi:dihydroflavonol-4-reductase
VTQHGPAFVTGGTGFVGGAVVRALLDQGREVRALGRSDQAVRALAAAGAIPVRGDVASIEAVVSDIGGCTTLFHAAGVNAMCLRDPAPMLRTNVEGSAAVVGAAARAGVHRVVYTSSAAVIGEPAGVVGREDTPHRGRFLSAYERSKYLAERRVFEVAARLGVDVVAVNPSSVQGPGRTSGSARLLLGLVNGRVAVTVSTFLSIVDVDDCTRGHLLAETHGRPGDRYLLNGASMSTAQAVDLIRSIAGGPRHVVRLPRGVARLAGSMAAATAWFSGRSPRLCPELVRTLLHGHRYDGSKASRELGLAYRPIEETVRRTLSWYADRGLIRPLDPA